MLAPLLLGIAHGLVDATTVSSVMRASHSGFATREVAFAMVLGYDLLAFGSQVFFGWWSDRFATPRVTLILGLVFTVLAVPVSPWSGAATVALAGLGNALFHLGAGAHVLGAGLERSAPVGVFVGPGALGLGFGVFYGAGPHRGPLWPLLVLSAGVLVAVLVARKAFIQPRRSTTVAPSLPTLAPRWVYSILGLLLLSIVVRSLVGLSASRGYPRDEILLIGLPIAAFLGKTIGGFLADRLGWLELGVAALLLSLPLIVLSPPAPLLLVGLLLFQMTMPVTLTAVARLMPHRIATAFGWTCLALIIGALPTMLPGGSPLCARNLLGLWILLGTACLAAGLYLLPGRPGRLGWSQRPIPLGTQS